MFIGRSFATTADIATSRRSSARSLAALALLLSLSPVANAQTVVPTNASPHDPACIVSSAELNGWFKSGVLTLIGFRDWPTSR